MYGLVNKAIEEWVKFHHPKVGWDEILEDAGVDVEYFVTNQSYEDGISYKLFESCSKKLQIPLNEILIDFGKFWVLHTGKKKYGDLMSSGGKTLKEFLLYLPNFHTWIQLMFPDLQPPDFRVSDISENSLHLTYISKRNGLEDFVKGLILGLGEMFQMVVEIQLLASRKEGDLCEVFKISWQ